MAVIFIVLAILLVVVATIGVVSWRSIARNRPKRSVSSGEVLTDDERKDLQEYQNSSEKKTIDNFDADVELDVNEKYLTEGLAEKNITEEILKDIGTEIGIAIGAEAAIAISKKGAKVLGAKLVKTAVAKAIVKVVPKVAIKAGATAAKAVAKLSNPVGWGLMMFDAVSALWDITDVGKLSGYRDAQEWLELRDLYKKEWDKEVKTPIVVGPLTKLQKDNVDGFLKLYEEQLTIQTTKLVDKLINELPDDLPVTEMAQRLESQILANKDQLNNMTYKAMCQKQGGKYLGGDICSYATKLACDNSYSWPLKDGDLYAQYDNGKCLLSWGGGMRDYCEKQGTANIGYDYDNKTCFIKEPYCTQNGYSYLAKDPEVKNFPNCYKTTERKILDVVVGETVTQDFQNLFSKEKNCGDRCSKDQYCYTVTGRGGICLAKAKPGEACPAGMHESCEENSRCNLSSEGYAAAIGAGTAIVASGGALGLAGLVAAGAAGRSIHSNLGQCTAGQDGENPSSSSNPGHYLKKGLKGCSVAWPCPSKVKNGSQTEAYHCANIFEPCKPPKNDGEFCLLGQHHWCKEGSYCASDSKCAKKRDPGQGCFVGEACKSGTCSGGVCTDYNGKLPAGATCALARGNCRNGYFCGSNLKCIPKLKAGTACINDGACADGDCYGGVCLTKNGKIPAGATCALARGSCEDGHFCAASLTCKKKLSPGSACLTDGACASGDCFGGVCLRPDGKIPVGSTCALARGSCQDGAFCAVDAKCQWKKGKGGACLSGSVCRSGSCSWFTCN